MNAAITDTNCRCGERATATASFEVRQVHVNNKQLTNMSFWAILAMQYVQVICSTTYLRICAAG